MELAHLLSEVENSIQEEANESTVEGSVSAYGAQNAGKSSGQYGSDDSPTPSANLANPSATRVKGCKIPGCVVCIRGPPPSFEKGTPIWAQILHLVLYSLTESAKVSASTSPKAKIKKYFHLRDDIYEYISQHWDVICRRERIKNWRHTIGMTLSHYQKLFQNGYHIFQNTGYWSLKDNVPSPYMIDPVLAEGSPRTKRRSREKDESCKSENPNEDDEQGPSKRPALDRSPPSPSGSTLANIIKNTSLPFEQRTTNLLPVPSALLPSSPIESNSMFFDNRAQSVPPPSRSAIRFSAMKSEIERFKKEMAELQQEIDGLQEQVRVKNAEEQLLKFLQEGITAFRDRIKQRIELLRAEMLNNHAEHQQQINSMSNELTQLREMGSDLRETFQHQFSRLVTLDPKPAALQPIDPKPTAMQPNGGDKPMGEDILRFQDLQPNLRFF